mmetsp:Transcript_17901/g.62842  ORF Transcript_17901/g.62842 Transcript_17901/m.62842 type:complete len:220 (+) Transcript_17901:971-1630(+)
MLEQSGELCRKGAKHLPLHVFAAARQVFRIRPVQTLGQPRHEAAHHEEGVLLGVEDPQQRGDDEVEPLAVTYGWLVLAVCQQHALRRLKLRALGLGARGARELAEEEARGGPDEVTQNLLAHILLVAGRMPRRLVRRQRRLQQVPVAPAAAFSRPCRRGPTVGLAAANAVAGACAAGAAAAPGGEPGPEAGPELRWALAATRRSPPPDRLEETPTRGGR